MRKIILKELRGLPFSFRFDETTTFRIKKQYDAYATSQPAFTCSKLTIEILEQGVKYVQS